MNMTDMLLQMTLQSTWQLPQVSQSGSQTGGVQDQKGPSFQDLLNQRREDMTQNESTQGAGTDKGEDVENTQTDTKPEQDQQNEQMGAAVAATGLFGNLTAVPANFVEQTGSAETGVVQTATIEAVLPDGQTEPQMTVQGQGATQQEVPQFETAVQQNQTVQQPAVQDNLQGEQAQVAQPQMTEANGAQAQNQGQENLSQDLAQDLNQSTDTQATGEQVPDAQVEGFQTPLFREVEATPVRVGDGEAVDMTAPAPQVEKSLADTLKGALDQGDQYVEIKLNPANLGSVTAEIARTPEGVLHVVLHAESEHTAKLLSDHAANLGLILQDSTRGEVRVQVAQPQENQSAWQHPDQEGGQQQQQQRQSQQQNTPRQEAENFLHQLRLGMVQMEADAV